MRYPALMPIAISCRDLTPYKAVHLKYREYRYRDPYLPGQHLEPEVEILLWDPGRDEIESAEQRQATGQCSHNDVHYNHTSYSYVSVSEK